MIWVIIMSTILRLENLVKTYGNKTVIKDVSFSLEQGKIYGLLGPNGAGKTTIMKIIMNLVEKNSGTITCDKDIKIGYLMDVPKFYEYMTVEEYLNFLADLNKTDKRSRVNELIAITKLEAYRNLKIKKLSRGLRQKLGIASVLINDNDILILDEPISALDPLARKEILDLISSLQGKMCVIFSSHILEDIEKVCNHILLINEGSILLNDSCENIFSVDDVLLVQCGTREGTLLMKEEFAESTFSSEKENTLIIPYIKLIDTQQLVLKIAKKLKVDVICLEVKRNTLQEIFLKEVRKNG